MGMCLRDRIIHGKRVVFSLMEEMGTVGELPALSDHSEDKSGTIHISGLGWLSSSSPIIIINHHHHHRHLHAIIIIIINNRGSINTPGHLLVLARNLVFKLYLFSSFLILQTLPHLIYGCLFSILRGFNSSLSPFFRFFFADHVFLLFLSCPSSPPSLSWLLRSSFPFDPSDPFFA